MIDERVAKIVLFVLVWIGAAALAVMLTMFIFGVTITVPIGVFSPLALLLFVPIVSGSTTAVRRRQAMTITTYIEQAVRLGMPIHVMLEAAAVGESPKVALRLRNLSESLGSGASLDAAIEFAVPEIPARDVGLIGAGQRTGNLAATLARLVKQGRREIPRDTSNPAFFAAYPVIMTLFITGLITLIMVFVIPKYEQIFKDFGLRLPTVTVSMIAVVGDFGPILLSIVAIVALAQLGRALLHMFVPLAPGVKPLRSLSFWFLSRMPPTRGVIRNRDLADIFEVFADAADSGLPLDAAMAEALNLHLAYSTQQMLDRWFRELQAGASLTDSARRAGLPDLIVGLLSTAQAAADVPATFRFISRYYREKFSRTMIVLRAAFIPFIVILFAIPVLWVCLGLFSPAIALIQHIGTLDSHMNWRRL